jgi:hypothetical protein
MKPADPRFEYIPTFLLHQESADLFNRLEHVDGFHLETGSCKLKPSHATVQWGPRQAYLSCVPMPYRVGSSGDIPDWLMPLKLRLEAKYDCYFDSVQVNKHFNQNAIVHSQTDSPPGHICMVSLGAERDFVLSHIYHKPLAKVHLHNGSLLTFFPKDQWRMHHAMPRSKVPCCARYGLIFRYITDALVKEGSLDAQFSKEQKQERKLRNVERSAEYEAVQAAYRQGGYEAVDECLRLKPWTMQKAVE